MTRIELGGLGQPVAASTWFTFTALDGLRWSLGGAGIVTLKEKAGPALGYFSDVTGNTPTFPEWWPGQFIKCLYENIWSFSCRGLSVAPASFLLLLTCCVWISINQPPTERRNQNVGTAGEGRERRPAHPIFRKTPAWIDCSLFKDEQRNPTEGFWKGSAA